MNISRHILNEALDLSMEWEYKNSEKLSSRIQSLYPNLNKDQANYIEKICLDVKKYTNVKAKSCTSLAELTKIVSDRYNYIGKNQLQTLCRQEWFWRI